MCGLLAASGKINPHFIKALGCLNSKRGKDSAGVAWTVDGTLHNRKVAANPLTAFTVTLADAIEDAAKSGIVIGHTRAATTGDVTNENAHPFIMEGIVFAHNGIISNHAEFGAYAVDSQALIHGIKERNFSKYNGSIALVWIYDNKLHAFRHGNPLYRGLKDGALYLASEEDMLKSIGCQNVRELADGHLYTIAGGGIVKSFAVPVNKSTIYAAYSEDDWQSRGFSRPYVSTPYVAPAAKIAPKPKGKAVCECKHKGKDHNATNGSTGGWACYGKVAPHDHICPCNFFLDIRGKKKREKAAKEKAAAESKATQDREIREAAAKSIANVPWAGKCTCDHALRVHAWRGGMHSCNVPNCKCTDFEAETIVTAPPPPDVPKIKPEDGPPEQLGDQWAGLEPNLLCDCSHELEYHNKGAAAYCHVQNCVCKDFWPIETQPLVTVGNNGRDWNLM